MTTVVIRTLLMINRLSNIVYSISKFECLTIGKLSNNIRPKLKIQQSRNIWCIILKINPFPKESQRPMSQTWPTIHYFKKNVKNLWKLSFQRQKRPWWTFGIQLKINQFWNIFHHSCKTEVLPHERRSTNLCISFTIARVPIGRIRNIEHISSKFKYFHVRHDTIILEFNWETINFTASYAFC